MKYTEKEVIKILTQFSDNPKKVLADFCNDRANTPLDLDERSYNHFVYSFPVELDGEEVAEVTLASLHGGDLNDKSNWLMEKYFGHEKFKMAWQAFSHDTYLSAYLIIKKDFKLPKIIKGFRGKEFTAKRVNGEEFTFKLSYGYPDNENKYHVKEAWEGDKYYWFDNDIRLVVDIKEGWSLGKKINSNIKARLRDQKIETIIE